jgi:hypothetical protein
MINILVTELFCIFMIISLGLISRSEAAESLVLIIPITKLCEVRVLYLLFHCYISRS